MGTRQADQALAALGARKTAWARLDIRGKVSYLKADPAAGPDPRAALGRRGDQRS
jgi:hypothetical protein